MKIIFSFTQTNFTFYIEFIIPGRFQKFDFGLRKNLMHYGQEEPPEYDISKIKVPITLFWADNDWLTGEEVRLPWLCKKTSSSKHFICSNVNSI